MSAEADQNTLFVQLLAGFQFVRDRRDEKFGNGRLARNVFETAIRRLANRIADVAPHTAELLTTLEPADIVLSDVPKQAYRGLDDPGTSFNSTGASWRGKRDVIVASRWPARADAEAKL